MRKLIFVVALLGCILRAHAAGQTTPNNVNGGVYHLNPPTLSDGQSYVFSFDVNGNLKIVGSGAGGATVVVDSAGDNFASVVAQLQAMVLTPPLPTTPAVTGPFTASNLAESVVQPDDLAVSGSCSSTCANTVLFSQDMAGYQSISVQISSNASSNNIVFQTCDDTSIANCTANSHWVGVYCSVYNSNGTTAPVIGGIAATGGMYRCPKWGEFFRVEATTYVSGTIAVIGHLHTYPLDAVVSVGAYILGPLGSQTPAASVAVTPAGYTYGHISTDTTTTLKSGAGVLHTICVNSVGAASTITVDDATSATTPTVAVLSGATLGCYTYDVAFSTGLTIVTAVAAPDLTVAYR